MKQQALQLQQTPEYWTTQIQLGLLGLIQKYLDENKMKRVEFAKKIGVTKGYISQVMHGDYDHRISKMVELAMAVGYVPQVNFVPAERAFDENGLYEILNTSSKRTEQSDMENNRVEFYVNLNTKNDGYAYTKNVGNYSIKSA